MDFEQRISQLSPAKLALLELKLKKKRPDSPTKTQPAARQRPKYAPLSFAQERLWFLEQMDPDSGLYNLPAMLPLHGPADPDQIEEIVRTIAARHEALRTRFVVKEDNPYQLISDKVSDALDFSTIDLRSAEVRSNGAEFLTKAINDEIWVPFNLATGPLFRARLFLGGNNENLLLLVMHHIVSDGWSLNILTDEFRTLYDSARSGEVLTLPELPQQYVDYSIAQRELLEGEKLKSLLSYWRSQLEGAPSVLELPLDRPRPARQSFQGALFPFDVPVSALQNLRTLCRESGVVPFMVLLSVFKVLLFRYTRQSKLVVGTPIANRNHSELEKVIGFFTNTLVLCSSMAPDLSFRELLAQVRDTTLGAYANQELPFEKLVSELQPERSLSHNPLFQVMFTFQNLVAEKDSAGQSAPPDDPLSLEFNFSKFDLTLAINETGNGLSAVFEYATDLFDGDTIERMAVHYVNILKHVLQNPDEEISAFSFLSPEEEHLVVEQWNDTDRPRQKILPLHRRFENWAQKTPDATALVYRHEDLTYRELDHRAKVVAGLLRNQGVKRGAIVGICLPRSMEMVIGLLAILKAGAAYMPIEPDYPAERISYMLDDAGASHVLTTAESLPVISRHDVNAIMLDKLDFDKDTRKSRSVAVGPKDLAYVLFTSGSTGQPKGVMVSHGAIDNRLQWMQEEYKLAATDRVMQKTPYTFDVSVWEFFWTLSEGACLVIAEPERHKESAYLVDLIKKERVNCMHFVPSMLQMFLHEDLSGCDSLKRIVCSGEALTVEQCRRLRDLPGVDAHNLYGPTEAAVDVTHWNCDQWRDQYLSAPIGRPIANTQIYVLNEKMRPCPIGVPGELYIGGHNLAEGYLNKPELTAKQFVRSPFSKDAGARLYKTGDLVRFRNDGNIEYIGRIDSQVKLRGLRIELGEIESVLAQFPGISEAVVVVRRFDEHDERLAAYVVLEKPDSDFDKGSVSSFLAKKLPNYMVPSIIMTIPEMPLSANGKLDRKRLPEPIPVKTSGPKAPASEIERELLEIWRKYLKIDALGTNDDFFALGGHSILVTQVINSINGHYHLDVPVRLLFENPTVKSLAKALSEFEDEAWLNEGRTANAILTRSDFRLLQQVTELDEEEIDDFINQNVENIEIDRFENVDSLLAWSRNYLTSEAVKPDNGVSRGTGDIGRLSQDSDYLKAYLHLALIRAEIDGIFLGRPFARFSPPDQSNDLVAGLQKQGGEIFQNYVRETERRIFESGNGIISPGELKNYCEQILALAVLAAGIGPFPFPADTSAGKR